MVLSFPEPRRTPTRMKRLFFRSLLPLVPGALALPVWAAAGATPLPQGGASIALDAARSLVQPGAIPAAAVPDAPFFTLAEWKTPQQPTRPDAVFTLQFEAPVTDGSVLVYDAGKVEAQTAPDTWVPLHDSLGEKAIKDGSVGMIDQMKVVPVPDSYFPENTNFIIKYKGATVDPVQLKTYRILTEQRGVDGDVVEGRIIYDSFVLTTRNKGIYTSKSA